jgi:hypothetical protein
MGVADAMDQLNSVLTCNECHLPWLFTVYNFEKSYAELTLHKIINMFTVKSVTPLITYLHSHLLTYLVPLLVSKSVEVLQKVLSIFFWSLVWILDYSIPLIFLSLYFWVVWGCVCFLSCCFSFQFAPHTQCPVRFPMVTEIWPFEM